MAKTVLFVVVTITYFDITNKIVLFIGEGIKQKQNVIFLLILLR